MNILTSAPKVLQIDVTGIPLYWITIEEAIGYYAKDMVLYELGNPVATYRGGINRISGKESIITTNSIIATKGARVKYGKDPKLSNESLFERDSYLCAYCGKIFHSKDLSRDHIKPVCQGGTDIWMNVVTSCRRCNSHKGGRTVEQANMSLLYLPYTPNRYENLILVQGKRKILADQMEFLLSKVPKNSRLKAN